MVIVITIHKIINYLTFINYKYKVINYKCKYNNKMSYFYNYPTPREIRRRYERANNV